MAVPSQGELHQPVLAILAESKEPLSADQLVERLAIRLSLDDADMRERVPSGQRRIKVNTTWAARYLKNAGLVQQPSRGLYSVTDQGLAYHGTHDGAISIAELTRLAAIHDSGGAIHDRPPIASGQYLIPDHDVTPDQKMEDGYRAYRVGLIEDLLESIQTVSPDRFEQLTVTLLERMGFGKGESVGRSGDGGIDGVINQDALGLEKVYIQAKRWSSQVGEPEIRNFSGSLDAHGANKGVFITTSNFSRTATETARNISAGGKVVRLVDGRELASLMMDYGVGVVTKMTYEIKELDESYFREDE